MHIDNLSWRALSSFLPFSLPINRHVPVVGSSSIAMVMHVLSPPPPQDLQISLGWEANHCIGGKVGFTTNYLQLVTSQWLEQGPPHRQTSYINWNLRWTEFHESPSKCSIAHRLTLHISPNKASNHLTFFYLPKTFHRSWSCRRSMSENVW